MHTVLEYELKAVRALRSAHEEKVRRAAEEREKVLLRQIGPHWGGQFVDAGIHGKKLAKG